MVLMKSRRSSSRFEPAAAVGRRREEAVNGEGNLIIGCDCTGGTHTGSEDVVIGSDQTYTGSGSIIAGSQNTVGGEFNAVFGERNTATSSGDFLAGLDNQASAEEADVSGGLENKATAYAASIAGGYENTASGTESSQLEARKTSPPARSRQLPAD